MHTDNIIDYVSGPGWSKALHIMLFIEKIFLNQTYFVGFTTFAVFN